MAATALRTQPYVEVACGECGDTFQLSKRNALEHRRRGTVPRCRRCRSGYKPPRVTEAMRNYWRKRFTLDEIREMAAAIWPLDER